MINKLKQNNGSITLYVLIAMIFFVILSLSAFTISQNKNTAQDEEFNKIKSEYEKEYSVEQQYQSITGTN